MNEPESAQDDSEVLADLLRLMRLERLEDNLFRGESRDIGSSRVFGGQVLGQALSAADAHGGRSGRRIPCTRISCAPVIPRRRSFMRWIEAGTARVLPSRRVVAIQHGRPILNLAASFQRIEEGPRTPERRCRMCRLRKTCPIPGTTRVRCSIGCRRKCAAISVFSAPLNSDMLSKEIFCNQQKSPPEQFVWFRALGSLPDQPELHRSLLAYVSDYNLIGTAVLPHGVSYMHGNLQMASLDHAMWFHREARLDQWLLYALDSPSASGARGLARGQVFTRDGVLVASTAQEGLIRLWPETAADG